MRWELKAVKERKDHKALLESLDSKAHKEHKDRHQQGPRVCPGRPACRVRKAVKDSKDSKGHKARPDRKVRKALPDQEWVTKLYLLVLKESTPTTLILGLSKLLVLS